jgi:predicted DNA-binding transcriptional regulator YafY
LNRWQDKIASVPPTMPLLPPVIDLEVLSSIQEAVLQEREVDAYYRGLTSDIAEAILLHPLGLILRGNIMYLVATAYEYGDVRLYALHRMRSVIVREELRNSPKEFTLADYLKEGHGHFKSADGFICLEAVVSRELGQILAETPLSIDQTMESVNDGHRLTATVQYTWQLEWWILSQGRKIKIIEPKLLREKIITSR